MYTWDELRTYRRARTAFSAKVYGLVVFWLILTLIQWAIVCLIDDARATFKKFYYISLIAFVLAILLLSIFIFADDMRFIQFVNFIISLIIVELQIVATFILVVQSTWAEVLIFFTVCAVLIFLFLLIGILLPRRVDLTLDIAVPFIIAFIFLIVAVFVLTLLVCLWFPATNTYVVVEIFVSLTVLMFIVYHAQTIHGNRFAEMRLNDFFLGSLILFHHFLIIFWLTFYWQITRAIFTSKDSSGKPTTTKSQGQSPSQSAPQSPSQSPPQSQSETEGTTEKPTDAAPDSGDVEDDEYDLDFDDYR